MILGVIPARYASTRFPGKPLIDINGLSMVQRVYRQVEQASKVDQVVVATDDARIFNHVQAFGGTVLMTNVKHPSGTDRCAEVARHFPKATHILNIQGDEPFIQPAQIDLLVETLIDNKKYPIATLAKRIEDSEQLFNPNTVKVVFSDHQGAIYFSRHPIPYLRNEDTSEWVRKFTFYKHIGLYGYTRHALLRVARLYPTPLECAESLEQLRWLENKIGIAVGITDHETIGIDTPDDLLKIKHL
ncbi:MAG: 3-deoxy-manno-octulosonate cytidylyltransferase [Bacteroidota bacterium]